MESRSLEWEIEPNPERVLARLAGLVNEDFDYNALIADLSGHRGLELHLDLCRVKRINSMGIREWFNFLSGLSWPKRITLVDCSTPFTQVLTQVEEMSHGCHLRNCRIPVWCPECEDDFEVKIELTKELLNQKIEFPCPQCSTVCRAEVWGLGEIVKKQAGNDAD